MAPTKLEHPYYPIIYVRGYAGNEDAVEDTVADPYMGFNLGATKIRQLWDRRVQRHYFESPLVRLMKDYGYRDVYTDGAEMPTSALVPPRSVVIFRYYDQVSSALGVGERPRIEKYAADLNELIENLRDRVCADNGGDPADFRVYLVAHSMGGLVSRCFLQNDQIGNAATKALVDKAFTYATPHNGIDLNYIGNVPGFFSRNSATNFNRERMIEYLGLPGTPENVASLNDRFDPDRFFCLVGTNDRDYAVAHGVTRKVVGPMSDGLVRIANATVWGPAGDGAEDGKVHAPRAFVHRSHSGHYGIVNSEEGYQNLRRFLFGDARVDGKLEITSISLPGKLQKASDAGKKIRASYHFEVVVRVRGKTWDLHRRTVGENSAVFRSFDEMLRPAAGVAPRHPHLFSTFLDSGQRVNRRRRSVGFSVDLGILVPEYEVDNKLWRDDHYEGGYLYRDKINLEATPDADGSWKLRYGFDSKTPNKATRAAPGTQTDAGLEFRIPVVQNTKPGIKAELVLTARRWS